MDQNQNRGFKYLGSGLPEDILKYKINGDFPKAIQLSDMYLSRILPEALKQNLLVQKEIMKRTPLDFPYTEEEALNLVRKYISDFNHEDLEVLTDKGRVLWIFIEGKKRYFARFFETLLKTDRDFVNSFDTEMGIAKKKDVLGSDRRILDESMDKMKRDGFSRKKIRIKASVRIKDEYFTPGFVRVHIPFPSACSQQKGFEAEEIRPHGGTLSSPDSEQRTVSWEKELKENETFSVVYSFTHEEVYKDAYSVKAEKTGITGEAKKENTDEFLKEELPHIVFTPFIKSVAESLAAGENDNLSKARKAYDFITLNMKYNFMPAYFIMEDIPENCIRNMRGDCGVFALLFITLLRCMGIHAKWQSGLTAEPDFCGAHDWTEFYAEPFGWITADPSYGVGATREGNEERRRFYFGNLDPYRMVANRKFMGELIPHKKYFRADPYDNQVGEIENSSRGLTYEEYDRTKEVLSCIDI